MTQQQPSDTVFTDAKTEHKSVGGAEKLENYM